jgi:hypothetical protein
MSFRFYPTLESRKDLIKKINIIPTDDYYFMKCNEYGVSSLNVSSGKIKDTLWDPRRDSLRICRDLKINDPYYLWGEDGVACEESKLGICIIWTNASTSMSGCILPREGSEKLGENGWSMYFEHTFFPGEVKGLLDLKIILYLKEAALEVKKGEEILNNVAGRILGEFETYRLEVSDETIPFPFVIDKFDTDALWWVDFYNWEDASEDAMFGASSFVVYLNSQNKSCPKVTAKGIQNIEMMYEITASVYSLLFKKLSPQEFKDMQLKKGKPGTIGAELSRMYDLCKDKFDFNDDYEKIHKFMQEAIRSKAAEVTDLSEVTNE